MEYGLGLISINAVLTLCGLNPCFNGIWSRTLAFRAGMSKNR